MRDVIRKVERDYKVTNQSNTVEYLLKGLEPGGRYSVSVRLRNMSKEASYTLSTGTLQALTMSGSNISGSNITDMLYVKIHTMIIKPDRGD